MIVTLRDKQLEVVSGSHDLFWQEVNKGIWEGSTFRIFDRFLDPRHSYIDIGAWIGPTLLYGCQLSRTVYGLEPDPIAFAELDRNVSMNKPLTDNIHLVNACIAPKSGEVALGSRGAGGDSTSSLLFARKRTHWTVRGWQFEDFIREYAVTDCNFIKMDIEGGEYEILPTMSEYLQEHRPTLHLSMHPLYLKLRPLGWIGRVIARARGTLRIIRSVRFYKHIYDHDGHEMAPRRLLWLCLRKIAMDIVVTDLEWGASAQGQ